MRSWQPTEPAAPPLPSTRRALSGWWGGLTPSRLALELAAIGRDIDPTELPEPFPPEVMQGVAALHAYRLATGRWPTDPPPPPPTTAAELLQVRA